MQPQIQFCRYHLRPLVKIGSQSNYLPREGALLRVVFEEGSLGYGDCFPWSELGDLPLSAQLEKLRKGELTQLTRRSLEFARKDAEARRQEHSLFASLSLPLSHWLVTNIQGMKSGQLQQISELGFREIKVKVGASLDSEIRWIKEYSSLIKELGLKLRLDFNTSVDYTRFEDFLKSLEPALELVDFIEDPTPYEPAQWRRLQEKWKIRLAADRIPPEKLRPGTFSVLIIKPAIQDPKEMLDLARTFHTSVVVTSYLDHPLGQLGAAWWAGQVFATEPQRLESCGLLSQVAYEPTPFSDEIRMKNGILTPPSGPGFGMGHLLSSLPWIEISSV